MTKRVRERERGDRNRDNNNYNKTNRDKLTHMYVKYCNALVITLVVLWIHIINNLCTSLRVQGKETRRIF